MFSISASVGGAGGYFWLSHLFLMAFSFSLEGRTLVEHAIVCSFFIFSSALLMS